MKTLIIRFLFGTPPHKVNVIDPKENNNYLRSVISNLNRERRQLIKHIELLKQEVELQSKILGLK